MVGPLTDQEHQSGHHGEGSRGLKERPVPGRVREHEVHKVVGRTGRGKGDPKVRPSPARKSHLADARAGRPQPIGTLAKENALGGTDLWVVPRIHVSFIEDLLHCTAIEMSAGRYRPGCRVRHWRRAPRSTLRRADRETTDTTREGHRLLGAWRPAPMCGRH